MMWLVQSKITTYLSQTYVEQEDTREKIDIDVLNKEIAETVAKIDHFRAEIDKIVGNWAMAKWCDSLWTDNGESAIELHLDNGTVWLTQQELAELFKLPSKILSKHIKRLILIDGELDEAVVVNYQLTTTRYSAMAGKTQSKKKVAYYNLDMILVDWLSRYTIFKIILKK